MMRISVVPAVMLIGMLASEVGSLAQEGDTKAASFRELIRGEWRGNSVCLDKNSACHDEVNVYRFGEVAGKPETFLVTASKIVDGKEIEMGSAEWKYDEKAKTLECERPKIRLTMLRAGWMEGVLRLEDGKEYRKIRLKKTG